MIKRVIIISLTVFVSHAIHCQSDYEIFRLAISDMYKSSQAEKSALENAVEESEKTVSKYRGEKPKVSVFGGTPEQNEQLENEIIEFTDTEISSDDVVVDAPPPPPPPREKRKKAKPEKPQKKKEKLPNINYTQKPMFPNKALGKKLISQEERSKQPREKIEWIEGPTITTTETIYIEDIPDPVERKKATEIGNHNGNIIELRRINFIEVIYNESQTETGFNKMIKDLDENGIGFSKNFKTIKALEGNEKVEYIKGKLLDLVNKVQ